MDLIKAFSADTYASALEAWEWIDVSGRQPIFASLFGDLFLEDGDGVWFLDIIGGHLTMEWPDRATLEAELETPEGSERWLLVSLAHAASESLALAESQIYDFVQNPVLGGAIAVENLSATDFEVAVDMAGQIHRQVAPLASGTRISGASLKKLPTRRPNSETPTETPTKRRRFGRR